MVKIDKMDAFLQVIKALDKEDVKTADGIMKVISVSIEKDKKNGKFSRQIEISERIGKRLFRELINNNN